MKNLKIYKKNLEPIKTKCHEDDPEVAAATVAGVAAVAAAGVAAGVAAVAESVAPVINTEVQRRDTVVITQHHH